MNVEKLLRLALEILEAADLLLGGHSFALRDAVQSTGLAIDALCPTMLECNKTQGESA